MKIIKGRKKILELCVDLLYDESSLSGAWCEAAAWPETPEEAAGYFESCRADGLPVTISGGLTGIAGGALPQGGAVLSTSRMNGIEILDNGNVRAGAGVTLAELREFLSRASSEHFYPPDPTEETATVGGTVSTDASGSDSFLYGSTRNWVESLTILPPSGKLLKIRRNDYTFRDGTCRHPDLGELVLPALRREQPPKNTAGYHIRPEMDLTDLFIGSEGTLGLVMEAELRLRRKPGVLADLVLFPGDSGTFWELFHTFLENRDRLGLRALEMMDGKCIEFLGAESTPGLPSPPPGASAALPARIEAENDRELENALLLVDDLMTRFGIPPDMVWIGLEPAERKKIKDFRHALPEAVNRRISMLRSEIPGIHKFGSDGAVPPVTLETYYETCRAILTDLDLEFLIFGHAGQGHLHANVLPGNPEEMSRAGEAMREIAREAVKAGGTISAEHGLGRLKAGFMPIMYSREEIEGMEKLRRAIDPDGFLAPALQIGGAS